MLDSVNREREEDLEEKSQKKIIQKELVNGQNQAEVEAMGVVNIAEKQASANFENLVEIGSPKLVKGVK